WGVETPSPPPQSLYAGLIFAPLPSARGPATNLRIRRGRTFLRERAPQPWTVERMRHGPAPPPALAQATLGARACSLLPERQGPSAGIRGPSHGREDRAEPEEEGQPHRGQEGQGQVEGEAVVHG